MAYIGNGITVTYVEANNVGSSQIIDFTVTSSDMSNTGVTAGTYGNSSAIPVLTVDQAGRVTAAVTNAVAGVTGFSYTNANNTFTITTGAGSTFSANIVANTLSNALTDTGVTAGAYGNSTAIPVITVDAKGRVTTATTNTVAGVTDFTWTAANNTLTLATSIGTYTANLNSWSGAVSISNTLATGNTTITGFANVSSTLRVTGATTLSNTIAVTGNAVFSNTIAVTGNATFSNVLIATSEAYFTNTVGVTGAATFSNAISVAGNAALDVVSFNQTPNNAGGVGRMLWNDTDGTLDLGLKGGNVTLQLGQEQHFRIMNQTGSTISNGKVVGAVGSVGASGRIKGALFTANTSTEEMYAMGIATEDIANGAEGFVTQFGSVRSIDTSGTPYGEVWADGDILYASATTAGALTKTQPTAPNLKIVMAMVVKAHATQGTLFVRPTHGTHLRELHDVNISSAANNDFIQWDNANSRWTNRSAPTVAGALTVSNTAALGNTTITGFANVTSTLQVGGTSSHTGAATFSNTTAHTGAATFSNTIAVTGATTLSSTLAAGNTTITGFANVTSSIQGGGSLTVAGALAGVTTAAMGNTTVTGFANVSSTLQVTGVATFSNAVVAVGNATFANTVAITGTLSTNSVSVANYIDFANNASTPAQKEGRVFYDASTKTLAQYVGETDITLNIGQEQWFYVYNATGATINNGSAVRFAGATSGVPLVQLASANSLSGVTWVAGIATHSIENNTYGYVTVQGKVNGVDLTAFNVGDPLYVSPTTPGGFTKVAPSYPYYAALVGGVLSNTASGSLMVKLEPYEYSTLRVTGEARVDGPLTVAGDFIVLGNTTSTSVSSLNVANTFIYLSGGNQTSNTNFTGTGLNDASWTGHLQYSNTTTFYVKIDSVGATDTFAWSTDNFATTRASAIAITGNDQWLGGGMLVRFEATTGHTLNDKWSATLVPANQDSGFAGNFHTGENGTYGHAGLFRDATDGKFKFFTGYTPEPNTNINISDASFAYANVVANNYTGNLIGNVTGNADTATLLATTRNVALTGIVSGNTNFNGGSNVTITTTLNTIGTGVTISNTLSVGNTVVTGTANISSNTYIGGGLYINTGTGAADYQDIRLGGIGGWSSNESHGIETVYGTYASPTVFTRVDSMYNGSAAVMRWKNFYYGGAQTSVLMSLTSTGASTGTLLINGALNANGTLATGNTTVTGFANISSTLQVSGGSTLTGAVTMANTLAVTGLITGTVTSANNADYLDGQHGSYYSNATNISTGTLAFARLPSAYIGTTAIQSTSASQALAGITTLAAGNTTITGFANVSSSVSIGYNSASSLTNSTFNVALTTLGGIHFINGGGTSGAGNEAAITFMGSSATQAQAGIYVHNNNSEGTHMAFATTDSYATGPQIGLRIMNTGYSYFPRSYVEAAGSFRAPYFYDSNNTAYYVDPAGTSILSSVRIGDGTSPLLSEAADYNLKITGGSGSSVGVTLYNSAGTWGSQWYADGGSNYGFLNGNWASWDIQKAINGNMYLNNNTTYYLNPPNTSKFSTVNVDLVNTGDVINLGGTLNGTVATSNFRGIEFHTAANRDYYIGKLAGAWTQPLDVHFYTGIRLTAHQSYDYGTSIWNISSGNRIAQFGYAGDNIYLNYSTYVPVIYDSNNTSYYADFASTGTSINTAGDIVSNSDRNLKENIVPITNAIAKIRMINGVTYNKIGETNRTAGVIAQDVLAAQPELVTQQGQYLSVAYGNMAGLFVEGIKEHDDTIESLKQEVAELKALVKQLLDTK